MADQLHNLTLWAQQQLGDQALTLQPLYGDASRRRYFRVACNDLTYILADATAEKNSLYDFCLIAKALQQHNVHVPAIIAQDLVHGYMLESDFGDRTLLSVLNAQNAENYYQQAFDNLLKMQLCDAIPEQPLPDYDIALLKREWGVFTTWFLEKYHNIVLAEHAQMLDDVLQLLIETFFEQPQVFVHRDYHSRNLMVLDNDELGIIDFQGAKRGPITYDLVSLIKGCYIDWPTADVQQWAVQMQTRMWQQHDFAPVSEAQFLRWFDLTGLQRHLKVLGQFARQSLAEGNDSYMPDMPRVIYYVLPVCARYPELKGLETLLRDIL
jgi:aminoglycoside/choline kinase family phosphotransferase